MLLAGSALKGFALAATDGRLGTVNDLLFSDETWTIRWLVVDTGVWLTGRKVLVHPSAIGRADYERRELAVALTMAQVESSPDILQDEPVSRQMENDLYGYYGWDPLWSGGFYVGGEMTSPIAPSSYFGNSTRLEQTDAGDSDEHGDPHLRSMKAVTRYHIHAGDGEIGHVENLLVDSASWTIRCFVVETRNWWPGKHVLLSPVAIREISWANHEIRLDVTRDQVKASPRWDPLTNIDHNYTRQLQSHYGWRETMQRAGGMGDRSAVPPSKDRAHV